MSCIEEEKGELSEGEGEIYILLTVAHRVDIGAHELFVFTCWQTEEGCSQMVGNGSLLLLTYKGPLVIGRCGKSSNTDVFVELGIDGMVPG